MPLSVHMALSELNTNANTVQFPVTGPSPKVAKGTKLKDHLNDADVAMICDTLDLASISLQDYSGTMLTPATLMENIKEEHVKYHVWTSTKIVLDQLNRRGIRAPTVYTAVLERLVVELGKVMIDRCEGPHITFVDTRLHGDARAMCDSARRIIRMFEKSGIERSELIISIPATEAGLVAANKLEIVDNIRTNMVYVSSISHAAACAEAQASMVSMPIGQVLEWYERKRKGNYYDLRTHPGMEVIQATAVYIKIHGIPIQLMGTNPRKIDEVGPLGCLDGLSLPRRNLEFWDSRLPVVFTKSVPESSPAYARAQGVRGTSLAQLKQDQLGKLFLEMSVKSKEMFKGITKNILGHMTVKLREVDEAIHDQVLGLREYQSERVKRILGAVLRKTKEDENKQMRTLERAKEKITERQRTPDKENTRVTPPSPRVSSRYRMRELYFDETHSAVLTLKDKVLESYARTTKPVEGKDYF